MISIDLTNRDPHALVSVILKSAIVLATVR